MAHRIEERRGHRLLLLEAAGPPLGRVQDVLDLVAEAFSQSASVIVVPAASLDPSFFALRSGLAGEFVQKIVNYRLRLAVIGDPPVGMAPSTAWADFVRESNRGASVFFLPDLKALEEKLTAPGGQTKTHPGGPPLNQ